jgi:carboxymethylenebutenolidase
VSAVPGQVEDRARLVEEEVSFPGDGGDAIAGYLVRLREEGRRPGLIVIHEAFGLNEHVRDVARRFANVGYDALAPDLYSREGAPPADDREALISKMMAMPDARIVGDLEGAAAHLRQLPGASGRVASVGFCSGGRQTLLLACSSDVLDAAVDCWGGSILRAGPDAETTPERPVPIVALADRLACPTLLVAGAQDANPTPDDVRAFVERADAAGRDATAEVYDDAGHAFLADYRPTYRPEAAARLWPNMLAFLDAHLR